MKRASQLKEKTVLLTGASGGIGTYLTQALTDAKSKVIGIARSQSKLERLQAEIETAGGEFQGLPFDLSQIDDLANLVNYIHQQFGPIDILINNAGIEQYRAFQDYSTADLKAILTTNLLSAMELTRLILPDMLQRNAGQVVNIASIAAKKGHPFDSVYSASKAGLLMWSDALRQELSGTGVQVTVVCPGYVSDVGMLADTGVPAPILSGSSSPQKVANIIVKSIQEKRIEVIFNQNALNSALTRVLLSLWQLFPEFGDATYRLVGIDNMNKLRILK